MEENKCPYYQGVCGIDEQYLCYCSSNYVECDIYNKHIEKLIEETHQGKILFRDGKNTIPD